MRRAHTCTEKEHASMEEEKLERSTQVNVPIEWHVSDDIKSIYASNVVVQPGQHEIILSLFEIRPPILTGTPEENRAKIEQIGTIRAECVGRIVVDPDLVPNIITALQTTLDNYHAAKAEEKERSSP